MIYIKKGTEPEWLVEFKRKHPHANYDSKEFNGYRKQLKEILIKEQKGLCAYCCGKITMDSSHNEHIEPRNPGTFVSKKSLDYNNIVASCKGFKGDETCGKHKKNVYDEDKFISPLNPECEDKFTYYPDGIMDGDDYTTELLHLNSYELREARKAVYKQLLYFDKEMIEQIFLDESSEEREPFVNVAKWYVKTL